jgi:hypothetical protein
MSTRANRQKWLARPPGWTYQFPQRAEQKATFMKLFSKIIPGSLIVAALLYSPVLGHAAESTNKAPAAEKQSTEKKAHPFRGKLAAVDKAAKTITIGKSVYYIISETRIKKDGKDATFEDAVIGDQASGYAKPTEGGKMAASSLNLGLKSEEKSSDKKKSKKESEKSKEKSQPQ